MVLASKIIIAAFLVFQTVLSFIFHGHITRVNGGITLLVVIIQVLLLYIGGFWS